MSATRPLSSASGLPRPGKKWASLAGATVARLGTGPYVQVSRLGNPLINELLIGIGQKDYWNTQLPAGDKQFVGSYTNPLLAQLLPTPLPGRFPEPWPATTPSMGPSPLTPMALTGPTWWRSCSPGSRRRCCRAHRLIPGTGVQADELRLNVAVPPTKSQPFQPRGPGRGHRRFPQRPPGLRRRGHDRADRGRGRNTGPGRQKVHSRTRPPRQGKNVSFGLTSSARTHRPRARSITCPTLPLPRDAVVGDVDAVDHAEGRTSPTRLSPVLNRWPQGTPVPFATGDAGRSRPGPGRSSSSSVAILAPAVLFTGPELDGEEIEIRPTGAPWSGTHVAVRERRLVSGPRWAALFGSLPAGTYQVRLKGDPYSPILKLDVEGGHIAQVCWPPG